ncbi:hypothetical protein FRB99_007458, partial [Tulasnella sp. 403]
YNFGWLSGDLIAGLTVGMILIPQSMSYAKIATLPPEYGLYSSFVGVFIYCFFATTKDVSIGPVAVMSLEVAHVIKHVNDKHPGQWPAPQIATTLGLFCGFIVLGIGLLRIGWLVEFISAPAVAGFMTGSAITIASQQVPGLLGVASRFDTRAAAYKVIINTLKNLPHCTKDAAFGLVGLAALLFISWATKFYGRKYPRVQRALFFAGTARYAFVIIILTLASYLYAHPRKDKKGNYPISILKTVPRGFKHTGAPPIDRELLSAMASDFPVATIIMLLEHIAIGKSFGRLNGYKIDPNQELVAIGVTNGIGSLFSAYAATGSFSRTAVKSKSGVRTPLAGVVTGATVVLALYALTGAFFWIPNAGLSAIIIAAVSDLVAPPRVVYNFWRISPLECIIWWAAVLVTVFSSIENGIYTSICASAALLIIRIARPKGHFLGRVVLRQGEEKDYREVFVPIPGANGNNSNVNPHIKVDPPAPGVVIYRPEESVLYPNSSLVTDALVDYVKKVTKTGRDLSNISLADRPWNDPGPRSGKLVLSPEDAAKPILRSVVLDFTAVSSVDTTSVQALIDVRGELERYASHPITFHFCHILNPWIRRGLVAGGFGIAFDEKARARIPVEIAPVVGPGDNDNADGFLYRDTREETKADEESRHPEIQQSRSAASSATDFEGTIVSLHTPYFHYDLSSAVKAAERDALAAGNSPSPLKRSTSIDKDFSD